MARSQTPAHIQVRSARMLNVDKGELVPGNLLVEGDRILEVDPGRVPDDTTVIDLGDVTLLPGLMDMEVNLLLGGPDHRSPLTAVQDDPAVRTLRAVANARRTLRAGFTTVRNLGLFIQTGGLLLDVARVDLEDAVALNQQVARNQLAFVDVEHAGASDLHVRRRVGSGHRVLLAYRGIQPMRMVVSIR